MVTKEPVEHGRLFWFFHNAALGVAGSFRRHLVGTSIALIAIAIVLFVFRAMYHPLVLTARKKSFMLVPVLLLIAAWLWARRKRFLVKAITSIVLVSGFVALFLWGGVAHDFIALYFRYQTLEIVELRKLPLTGHERLQPRNSILSLAKEKIQETESPQVPDYVREGNEYRWTFAIEPTRIRQFIGRVEEVVSVLPYDPSPNFNQREKVNFETGEEMVLSHNTHTATIKSFNFWRYLNYEPADIKYIKDDAGQWVQVVSLIRWRGVFFPWPEFGGVQLIRQNPSASEFNIHLMLLGTGEWIPPEDVPKHKFLVGQNNLPYEASRYFASSFRFQNGFMGPMPWIHQGDVRIPDQVADVNDQPFTTYFEDVNGNKQGALYHYFALEPFDTTKSGLNISLFIPADGTGSVYAYKHYLQSGVLTGVSAVADKVRNSRMQFDWTHHGPVENRPFIRDIDGVRRFFWLTTVVTYKKGDTSRVRAGEPAEKKPDGGTNDDPDDRRFIAGGLPNMVLTDADHNIPVWVSSSPEKWTEELKSDPILRNLWDTRNK